ncbi:MAG: PAS domain-containing protein [Pseudomonadota bacterium]
MSETKKFLAFNTSLMGDMMRDYDWSRSPLGHPDTWPLSLRITVDLMLDSKFGMFVAWGPELGLLYNDAYSEMLGGKHPAALGQRFNEIWSDIWVDILPVVIDALDGKASYFQDFPLLMRRNGYDERAWFTFSYSPIRDDDGKVAGVFCTATETTRQVTAETHLAEQNERLQNLFNQAPGYIVVLTSAALIFEMANEAYLRLIGRQHIIGKTLREILPELEGQAFMKLLDKAFSTGESSVGQAYPIMLQRQPDMPLEQRFIDFVYQPIRDARGSVSGIFMQGNDVTESVLASQALQASEERLWQLANTIPHLAWMANPDGEIHWYNDRWHAYTGRTLEEMRGWGWKSVHDPETLPTVMKDWVYSLATGTPFENTFPLRAANGEFRLFFTRAAPLKDAGGKIIQWFGTNTDVTDIETARAELKAASDRKDEFLAMLAHELRNPLAPISTAAELLNIAPADEVRVKKTAKIISRQVKHMTKLVDDLLDVSRVTRGLATLRADSLDIGDIVSEAVEQVHSLVVAKQQELSVLLPEEPARLVGDRTRLIQVVSNLLNNAVRYTQAGGFIHLQVALENQNICIRVTDNGIGMAPNLSPHIFELFTQGERSADRSQGGLGLGLALVKSLVELHKGSVSAFSPGIGKGSEFAVRLPLAISLTGANDIIETSPSPTLSGDDDGLVLMVVDDNEDAATTLSLLLEAIGHRVSVAHNATTALDKAREVAPTLMFLDIGLPDMDGYELAERLARMHETADAILVALTGYGQPEDKEKARLAGFDHHLVKPVSLEAITSLLATVTMH